MDPPRTRYGKQATQRHSRACDLLACLIGFVLRPDQEFFLIWVFQSTATIMPSLRDELQAKMGASRTVG